MRLDRGFCDIPLKSKTLHRSFKIAARTRAIRSGGTERLAASPLRARVVHSLSDTIWCTASDLLSKQRAAQLQLFLRKRSYKGALAELNFRKCRIRSRKLVSSHLPQSICCPSCVKRTDQFHR